MVQTIMIHTLDRCLHHCGASLILCLHYNLSRLTIVSREAKKKQSACDKRVSYLQGAPL